MPLAGVPLLGHALRGALPCADEIAVVVPDGWQEPARAIVDATCGPEWAAYVTVVPGGTERGDSVAAGLQALSDDVGIVLVHDAARCLAPAELFDRVVSRVRSGALAVVPGIPVVDTIKQVDASGRVVGTPDRSTLRAIQTPQGFRRDLLERAHAVSTGATDDATLVERLGGPVTVIDGDRQALKVTTADDLELAARILAE